jgi:hypothetical protein
VILRVEVIELKGSPGSPSVGAAVAQLFAKDPTLLEEHQRECTKGTQMDDIAPFLPPTN